MADDTTTQNDQQPDPEILRKELEEARKAAAKYRTRLRELEERMRQYEGVDPEEYRRLKEEMQRAEEERLRQQGQLEEILKRKEQEWQKRLQQLEEQAKSWEQRYRQVAIEERLMAAFARAGAIAPEECVMLTRHLVDLDDEGVYIRGEDGAPIVRDGKRVSLDEWARQWLEEHPHHLRAQGGGAGSQGGAGGSAKTMRRADWEKLSPREKAEVIRSGVRLVD